MIIVSYSMLYLFVSSFSCFCSGAALKLQEAEWPRWHSVMSQLPSACHRLHGSFSIPMDARLQNQCRMTLCIPTCAISVYHFIRRAARAQLFQTTNLDFVVLCHFQLYILCDVLSGLPVVHGGNWIRFLRLWSHLSMRSLLKVKANSQCQRSKNACRPSTRTYGVTPLLVNACDHQGLGRIKQSFWYEQVWWRASMYCMPTCQHYHCALDLECHLEQFGGGTMWYSIVSGHHHERGEVPAE